MKNLYQCRNSYALIILLLLSACVQHQYKAAPYTVESASEEIAVWSLDNSTLEHYIHENLHDSRNQINKDTFSFEQLYLTGLFYSPELKVAYENWRKAIIAIPGHDRRINPELDFPFSYNSRARDGDSPWTIGLVLNFIYERKNKRDAKRLQAEVKAMNAYMQIEKIASEIYAQFKLSYLNYIATYFELQLLEQEIEILNKLFEQLQLRAELGEVTEFELSNISLELQERFFKRQLIQNQLEGNKDKLLVLTHLNFTEPEALDIKKVDIMSLLEKFYSEINGKQLNQLQARLLTQNIEMSLALNQYALKEAELKLKVEEQYPDIVLSPGFVFEMSDNLWELGSSWILPIFKNTKINNEIKIALYERRMQQKKIIAQQKKLIDRLYVNYRSSQRYKKSLNFSEELRNSIDARKKIIARQIELGETGEIKLLRNRIEFLRAKQTELGVYRNAFKEIIFLTPLLEFKLANGANQFIKNAIDTWVALRKEREKDATLN